MSQRSLIQRLPGTTAHNRPTGILPRSLSLLHGFLHQVLGTRLFRGLIVLCLMSTSFFVFLPDTIPTVLANTTITSSHFSSSLPLKCHPPKGKKKCSYDPGSFFVSKMQLDFPPSPQTLELSNFGPPEKDGPIPWHVEIMRDTGPTNLVCGQVNWLRVDPEKGKVQVKKDSKGHVIPGEIVSVSVKKKGLPPGTTCTGNLIFIVPSPDNNSADAKAPIMITFAV